MILPGFSFSFDYFLFIVASIFRFADYAALHAFTLMVADAWVFSWNIFSRFRCHFHFTLLFSSFATAQFSIFRSIIDASFLSLLRCFRRTMPLMPENMRGNIFADDILIDYSRKYHFRLFRCHFRASIFLFDFSSITFHFRFSRVSFIIKYFHYDFDRFFFSLLFIFTPFHRRLLIDAYWGWFFLSPDYFDFRLFLFCRAIFFFDFLSDASHWCFSMLIFSAIFHYNIFCSFLCLISLRLGFDM